MMVGPNLFETKHYMNFGIAGNWIFWGSGKGGLFVMCVIK
jgi:hypothetical protein